MGHETACWKDGPLPPDTYGWGGAVPKDQVGQSGFYFADFCGDHVVLVLVGVRGQPDRTLKADEVGQYTNCLTLPPGCGPGACRAG